MTEYTTFTKLDDSEEKLYTSKYKVYSAIEADKRFKDSIWESYVFKDRKVRVIGCIHIYSKLFPMEVVVLDEEGNQRRYFVEEFEKLYTRVGKCKYTSKQLEDMRLEIEND